jgi:hypothetical protein
MAKLLDKPIHRGHFGNTKISCAIRVFSVYEKLKEVDLMNCFRFVISATLIFMLGCGGGPSTATAPKSSSSSEFGQICRAVGASDGKLSREKFIAQAKNKEAAAELFDACDSQHKGYLTEGDVGPGNIDSLKGQVIPLTTTH